MRAKGSKMQNDSKKSDTEVDSVSKQDVSAVEVKKEDAKNNKTVKSVKKTVHTDGVRKPSVAKVSSEKTATEKTDKMDTIAEEKVSTESLADASIDNDTDGAQGVEDTIRDTDFESLADEKSEDELLTDVSNLQVRRVGVDTDSPDKKTDQQGFLYSLMDTIRFVCLGLLIGILLVVFVIQRNDVYGSSMEPTLHNSDAVFVEMISKYFKSYDRGDIVTIEAVGLDGYDGTEKIIKRVIGLPGETVTISGGLVYIDGVQLEEPYLIPGVMTYVTIDGANKGYDQITLGENQYYCLGDNRGASNDSRRLGPIDEKLIKSHVIARIFPMDDMTLF